MAEGHRRVPPDVGKTREVATFNQSASWMRTERYLEAGYFVHTLCSQTFIEENKEQKQEKRVKER